MDFKSLILEFRKLSSNSQKSYSSFFLRVSTAWVCLAARCIVGVGPGAGLEGTMVSSSNSAFSTELLRKVIM